MSSELPAGWRWTTIGEIADRIAMGPFGSNLKVDCFVDAGIPTLNGSNLKRSRLVEDSFNYVSEEKAQSLKNSIVGRGDIVFTHRELSVKPVSFPATQSMSDM